MAEFEQPIVNEPISVPADSAIETGVEVPQPPDAGQQPTADSQQPDRAWATSLATDFGFEAADLADYPDEASARAAVRNYFDNLSRMGGSGGGAGPAPAPMPQPQPIQPGATAPLWQLDPNEFGLDADDPAFKAVAAYDKRMQQVVGALASHVAGIQQNTAEQSRQSIRGEINGAIDKFASPEFGTGENVSRFQAVNRERLFGLARDIAAGFRNSGRDIPPARQLLATAKFMYEQEKGMTTPLPAATANVTTLASRSPGAPGKPNERVGLLAPWSQTDPGIRAFLGK